MSTIARMVPVRFSSLAASGWELNNSWHASYSEVARSAPWLTAPGAPDGTRPLRPGLVA
jgi:hypothetical protein